MNNIIFSVAWIAVTSAALGLATYFNLRLPLLSSWLIDQQIETSLRGFLFALLLVGFSQGSILSIKERKFFLSWTAVTVFAGGLSVFPSLVSMTAALSLYSLVSTNEALVFSNLVPFFVGYVISGLLLGFGYSWLLRKLPRAKVMTWASLGYCIIVMHLTIMSLQFNGGYVSTSPEVWNWVRPVMIEGAIASAIQVAGLLYVLEDGESLLSNRYQKSNLLAKRSLINPSLYKATNQGFFYILWVSGTMLGLSTRIFDANFILPSMAIGLIQGLVLSRWFNRFGSWMFYTVNGSLVSGALQTVLFVLITDSSDNVILASCVSCSIAGVVLGCFHYRALRGFVRAKQMVWVDTLAIGLLMTLASVLAVEYPESALRLAIGSAAANALAVFATVCAIALQGAGLLHILKSEIVHNREINLQDLI